MRPRVAILPFFLIPSTDSKELLVLVACRRLCAQEPKHFHSENKWFLQSRGSGGQLSPPETQGVLFSTTHSLSKGEEGSATCLDRLRHALGFDF